MLLASEYTTERQIGAHFALVGTVDDIHREMDRLVETADPAYFIWQGDQGLLPLEEVKRQVGIFGTKVLPHYQ